MFVPASPSKIKGTLFLPVMAKRFGLARSERLKSRKQIEGLFVSGSSVNVFPIRALYKFNSSSTNHLQIGVSASKKKFKRAIDRNKIKRFLREAFRLQKNDFLEVLKQKNLKCEVFFIYGDHNISNFWEVYDAIGKCLKQLQQKALQANDSIT